MRPGEAAAGGWASTSIAGGNGPAAPQGHELIARQATPCLHGLRTRTVREQTQAKLATAKVTADLVVRDR